MSRRLVRFFLVLACLLAVTQSFVGAQEDRNRFAMACMALGQEVSQLRSAGITFLEELEMRTQVDPLVPEGWVEADHDLKNAPPFLWLRVSSDADTEQAPIEALKRFMAAGGTVLAESDGREGGIRNLADIERRLFGEDKVEFLEAGSLITRTFYILPDHQAARYRVFRRANRTRWIATDLPLLQLISGQAGGGELSEYAVRTAVNIVMYTLTGTYKDDLTHLRYLMRRKKL